MSFFRSEQMSLCRLILPQESAFDCLVELACLGKVQFLEDLHEPEHTPNLKYSGEIERCQNLMRSLRNFQDQLDKVGLEAPFNPDIDDVKPTRNDLKNIEEMVQRFDVELYEVERYCDTMQAKKSMLVEKHKVISRADNFLSDRNNTEAILAVSDSVIIELIRDGTQEVEKTDALNRLIYITGAVAAERFRAFELMVWRVSRGNAHIRRAEFTLPSGENKKGHTTINRVAFLIIFAGENLKEKCLKICQGFHANVYSCPETQGERIDLLNEMTKDLYDLIDIMKESCNYKRRLLSTITSELYNWRITVKKILQVYLQLNRLSRVKELKNNVYFNADVWVPTNQINEVRHALFSGAERTARGGEMVLPPLLTEQAKYHGAVEPTYFATNKFTKGFQNLIDSYGMAMYHELNPAPYTIITFPFLFAVMFGDMGHGLLMAIFAAVLIKNERKVLKKQRAARKMNEIGNILFAGRYIILLMGVFSIYTGLIYNDIFSKSFNIFGSQWRISHHFKDLEKAKFLQLDPANSEMYLGSPYLLGLDPVWDASGENAIITLNSIKMKTAIILGVTQMIFGLSLSAWNAIYFRSKIDLFLVVVPQLIFLICLFFYLVFLIFYKWAFYGGLIEAPYNSACAPSILITFINMVLMKGTDDKVPPECNSSMYRGQNILQFVLVIVALLVVPVLLCGKPIHFVFQHRKIKQMKDTKRQHEMRRDTLLSLRKSLIYNIDATESAHVEKKKKNRAEVVQAAEAPSNEEQEEKLSEIWIHQGIHTIESVLGSVSHTASYLRLWALSLAHDQLSGVLWNMVLRIGLQTGYGFLNAGILFFTFFFWAVLTIAILVIMEGLSAFLHTLRLHWVEFQSKFYAGSGEAFMPFKFEQSTGMD